jgi:hypothetical protein
MTGCTSSPRAIASRRLPGPGAVPAGLLSEDFAGDAVMSRADAGSKRGLEGWLDGWLQGEKFKGSRLPEFLW